jgi:hypothetical protein
MTPRLFFIMLRQPRGTDGPRRDLRSDPFWEFGSFGRTGCHKRNLMHHRRCPIEKGDALAFLQGGRSEFRIVGVTVVESVDAVRGGDRLELRWDKSFRPFCYDDAPILIDNGGHSHFKAFRSRLRLGQRTSLVGAVSSQFRSRTAPVDEPIAEDVIAVFNGWKGRRAANYIEAIQPTESGWRKEGLLRGWHHMQERERAYEVLRPG